MMRTFHQHRPNKNYWMVGLVLLWAVGWIGACASLPSNGPTGDWSCDAQADAAVELGQWRQAFEGHEKVLNEDPANCLAMYHLGYIWGKIGDSSQEVLWYQKAIACGYALNDVLFFNLGMAYGEMNQMDRAISAFKHAMKLNPGNAENYFGLALMLHATGDTLGAEQALTQAIDLSPHHWDARLLLAKIYLDEGNFKAARPHLEMVLNHAPDNDEANELWQLYKDRLSTSFDR
jgi:tetratricopeptide (TPR) repeat protein